MTERKEDGFGYYYVKTPYNHDAEVKVQEGNRYQGKVESGSVTKAQAIPVLAK